MAGKQKSPSLQATLTPAYNRDYASKPEAVDDFRLGKDFVFNLFGATTYCSIRDYAPGDMVKIRYNNQTCAAFYRVTERDLIRK